MKKSIALLALAFGVTGAFAQDLTSKKGEPILPEADDWSIGVDATPFLNYVGNMFGKTANNSAPTWNYLTSNLTITGKMMKDAQTAYRASVRLGFSNNTTKMYNDDRGEVLTPPNTGYPNTATQKENKWKSSNTNIGIAVGIEKRKGKTRLQGIYGAEAGFGIGMSGNKFEYGNALVPVATAPAVTVYVDNADEFNATINNVQNATGAGGLGIQGANAGSLARMTQSKSGMAFSFGVRGFIGAEYFVLPKMSLGGEFGWGIGFQMQGQSKTTWESIGNTGTGNDQVGTTEIKGDKSSGFRLDTDGTNSMFGPTGSLRLNFYF